MKSIGTNASSMIAGACRPDDGHDQPEAGREAVARRGRRDADHDARDEAERAGLETLFPRVVLERIHGRRHAFPPVGVAGATISQRLVGDATSAVTAAGQAGDEPPGARA